MFCVTPLRSQISACSRVFHNVLARLLDKLRTVELVKSELTHSHFVTTSFQSPDGLCTYPQVTLEIINHSLRNNYINLVFFIKIIVWVRCDGLVIVINVQLKTKNYPIYAQTQYCTS